ncbi:glycerophosphoryl diester phosphodiesterase [Nitrosococcus halophilus Nc 4]|uniref:Glycerophosphoryl diester phosphodiesterase n=1 Tax=Nitrosococcus halophilus (strain Nc4) TaxID=472759 RepID=D5C151_NITHN|nr:glycerophosphodiester phosphodiesterase family protein [Nitrosococcus halophilus]ADE14608.1 glycerophosphoryl diester phosphodiesterase [Nitrosococcus halophilus Nc 4]
MKTPQLIAHRGYAKAFPENTLLSLDAAVNAGARLVEFDVQLTADEIPVVLHDDTLLRTAGHDGAIFEMNSADLEHICVNEAARFGPYFPEVQISTLENIVLWLKGLPQVTAFVEIKTQSLRRFGIQRAVTRVLSVLEPVKAQCVLISFDAQAVSFAREEGMAATGWVLSSWDLAAALRLNPEYVFCNWTRIPPGWKDFAQYPWSWAIYEITEVEKALEYAAWGVEFIETMAIGEMLQHPLFHATSGSQPQTSAPMPVVETGMVGAFDPQPLG